MQHALPPPMTVERRSLSSGAAARVAGCHPTTIFRAIEKGELPALRLGPNGNYRIRREALEAWLRPTTGGETTHATR